MSEQKLHLLCIAPYGFLPAIAGGQKAMEQMYRNLGALVSTTVVSTQKNDETCAQQYRLIKMFSNSRLRYLNFFYFFKLQSLIKKQSITHLMIEHPYLGWLGFLLQHFAGVKLIIRSQNIEAIRFKTIGKSWWKMMWHYEKWVYGIADKTFFITAEDALFAVQQYAIAPKKCEVLTYGINQKEMPSAAAKQKAKEEICSRYQLPASHTFLLFNGDLGYAPNTDAVNNIIRYINSLLLQNRSFAYRLFICGKHLPEAYILQLQQAENIIYAGFVDDIVPYFMAADIFINPVTFGGGIKTKLVEAISYNCNAVSTASGAIGVTQRETNDKMIIAQDGDWTAFANAIIASNLTVETPPQFFDHFYCGNIAKKALQALQDT